MLTVLAVSAAIALAIAGWQAASKKAPALQAGLIVISPCLKTVKAANEGIVDKYAERDENDQPKRDAQGNPVFPAGLQIPQDDPAVVAIRSCEAELNRFTDSVKAGNHRALAELGGLIQDGLQHVGACTITAPLRNGIAGVKYSDLVLAHIPFSPGIGASGTIAASGVAAGTGSFRSTAGTDWTGR